jgi:S-adenosylmethionine:tRNA ribosyltransferase-isomerase
MKIKDYSFKIPENLIAQNPIDQRGNSLLMVLDRQKEIIEDSYLRDFPSLLKPGSVIVFNDTRVRKARIYGTAEVTGGRVEFLLLREEKSGIWAAITSKAAKQKKGKRFRFPGNRTAVIIGDNNILKLLEFDKPIDEEYLQRYGHVPLPPYIKREDTSMYNERYQTIFARIMGSAAAPTAGLHFTTRLLEEIASRDVDIVFITLHVELGTFLQIREENVEDHKMHEEHFIIPDVTALSINRALAEKRDIIAVGTTVVRALESAYCNEKQKIIACDSNSSLFIYPGFTFRVVKKLFTNFHTPRSSLLLLVSAFSGRNLIKKAYSQAVKKEYRFYSYGDAMYIL